MSVTDYSEKWYCLNNRLWLFIYYFFNPHTRACLLILERGEGREKVRERNINVREKHWLAALHTYPDQGWTATQACALTWNRTWALSVCGMISSQLSHTGQGYNNIFIKSVYLYPDCVPWSIINYLTQKYDLPRQKKRLSQDWEKILAKDISAMQNTQNTYNSTIRK